MKKQIGVLKKANNKKSTASQIGFMNLTGKSFKKIQYDFLSSTSHQLRTPIASVQSSLDVLELYIKKENTVRQLQVINKIKKTITDLNSTLERITTLYKNEIVKPKLKISKIEVNKFFNDLLDEVLAYSGDSCFITTKIEIQKKYFLADEFVLKQILLNILFNAVKFSPESGQIMLHILKNKNVVIISVKDEGIGIGKADQKKIFRPFFRAGNAAEIEGQGLGLAIVKNLCRLHKIKIKCISELDKGTEFLLSIPQK